MMILVLNRLYQAWSLEHVSAVFLVYELFFRRQLYLRSPGHGPIVTLMN